MTFELLGLKPWAKKGKTKCRACESTTQGQAVSHVTIRWAGVSDGEM